MLVFGSGAFTVRRLGGAGGIDDQHHAEFIVAAVALIASTVPGWTQSSRPAPIPCTAAMGLNYVCDLGRPEDFVWIPNTKYIITGGSAANGGWGLIDTETKTSRPLDLSQVKPDLKTYPIARRCRMPSG